MRVTWCGSENFRLGSQNAQIEKCVRRSGVSGLQGFGEGGEEGCCFFEVFWAYWGKLGVQVVLPQMAPMHLHSPVVSLREMPGQSGRTTRRT